MSGRKFISGRTTLQLRNKDFLVFQQSVRISKEQHNVLDTEALRVIERFAHNAITGRRPLECSSFTLVRCVLGKAYTGGLFGVILYEVVYDVTTIKSFEPAAKALNSVCKLVRNEIFRLSGHRYRATDIPRQKRVRIASPNHKAKLKL